jgi:tetratricopeptide (TPR) repeat protein
VAVVTPSVPPASAIATDRRDEPAAAAADLASTRIDGSSTLIDGSQEDDIRGTRLEEVLQSDRARFAATLAFGSSLALPEAPAAPAAAEPAPAPRAADPPPAAPSPVASAADPDEISVPPVGDVAISEAFFSEGDLSRHLHPEADAIEGDALTVTDTAKRKSDPLVVQRRARFARYVKLAVAGAAVVCLAALARTGLSSRPGAASSMQNATIAAPVAMPAVKKEAMPVAAPAAERPPAPEAKPAESKPEETRPAEAKPEEPVPGNAKEEKARSRAFLERQKIADAIEAGERAVKLDPTDGEAWLILGAAYQEKGNMAEARRAYASCAKDAMTGPRAECQKMLR